MAAQVLTYDQRRTMKRVGLVTLRVVAAVVALVAFVAGSVMVLAQTNWGGERLRRVIVSRANRALRGQVGIARLQFAGDRLTVWDVSLRDPEGQLAAQVARIEVDFRLWPLLRKEVCLTRLRVEAPRIAAVSGPRGLNLTRATEPRQKSPTPPSPPKTLTAKEGWVFRLDRFELTEGDVVVASATPTTRKEAAHLAGLQAELGVRYATGNGALDLGLRLAGKSVRGPEGPLSLTVDVHRHAAATHVEIDGALLGGTIRTRGDLAGSRLDAASTTASIAVTIPRTTVAGFEWGPVHIDGEAHPGGPPRLDLLIALPGIQLTARTTKPAVGAASRAAARARLDGRLAVADLAVTGLAVQGLAAGVLPTLAGHGDLNVSIEGPPTGGWGEGTGNGSSARCKGLFERLRLGDRFLEDLTMEGHTSQLSVAPAEAALRVAVASLTAGARKLSNLQLDLTSRQQDIALAASMAAPEAVELGLEGRFDDDRRGLALTRIVLGSPKAKWASTGTARLRFGDDGDSLRGFRLDADGGQVLAVDASRIASRVDAHLDVKLRLDLLPAIVLDPALELGGTVGADVKASGDAGAPRVVVQLRLENGRYRKLSKVRAQVDATLADRRVDGTLGAEAPFGMIDGAYSVPLDLPAPSSSIDLKVNATRIDLGDTLRGVGAGDGSFTFDGKLSSRLRIQGTAGDPRIDLTLDGQDLETRRPPAAASTGAASVATTIDVGRARLRLTYQGRVARVDVDFTSAHGGSLRADAAAGIDLSYPAVTEPINVKDLPVHGKVAARNFEVSWIAPFHVRIESLGGQVTADTRLAGTLGDPRFIGDVHWKNGEVVTTTSPPARGSPSPTSGENAKPRK